MSRPPRPDAPDAPNPPRPKSGPPLPENPYRRFFTPTPTFEALVRRARGDAPADPPAEGPAPK